MTETKSIRLNKVLKELNISIQRAIEFLKSQDIEIEGRPNTKIEYSIYEILANEFLSDKALHERSAQVSIQKQKEKEAIMALREKEIEQIRLKEISAAKTQKENNVIKAKATVIKPLKALGKIDLDKTAIKPKKKEEKISEKKPEKTKLLEETVDPKKEKPKKKAKSPAPAEKIETIETKYQKLEGLQLTGEKVDLTAFQKQRKKKEENKETESKEESKKKRKRIRKEVQLKSRSKNGERSQRAGIHKRGKVEEPTEEDIKKQIKETLDKLTGKANRSNAYKFRKEKRDIHREQREKQEQEQQEASKTIQIAEFITVSELASLMSTPITDIISSCMSLGIMVTMNQRLDAETLTIVAEEFGFEVSFIRAEKEVQEVDQTDQDDNLLPRAPIVAIMGHVDHGKTSLLDYIQNSNVIAGEAGGITQHIGAYGVTLKDGNQITFLDTPGHEAFTAMRARGAQITDLVIIVISADDDVMPQTKEAISHAQAAGVPIVFAINKIDKPDANPEKVKETLAGMNLLVEDWGGKIQSQDISAKTGANVDHLLEKVLLEAELLELKANPDRIAYGGVIEATLDRGRGYITTVLVQGGTLKIGSYIVAGQYHGKVKAMLDERSETVTSAGPSTPIAILGLDGAPQAGDKFKIYEDEKEAKQVASKRKQLQREQSVRAQKHITLGEIGRRIALDDFQELNIIIRADVDGSVEALTDSIQKLATEEIHINVILRGVGQITDSDVLLASASNAIIIGFQVRPSASAKKLAEKEHIDIRTYSIIYDVIDDITDAMEGMLSPELKEETIGNIEIREIFKISKVGTIAGCMVLDGKVTRSSKVRLIREGIVVHTGDLGSLKRFKDDVKEVTKGYECGLNIDRFNDIQVGDILEAYQEIEVRKKL